MGFLKTKEPLYYFKLSRSLCFFVDGWSYLFSRLSLVERDLFIFHLLIHLFNYGHSLWNPPSEVSRSCKS